VGKKVSKKTKPRKTSKPAARKNPALANIWPQERDIMMRPERFQYVRKLVKTEDCVFCTAHSKGASNESLVLWQDDNAMIMLNKYPYNSGHLLVLPTRHCGHLLELKDEQYFEVQRHLRWAVKAVIKCYQCSGVNLGLNHGKVAGAGIPDHLHWHVVPRWKGDTNFFPLVAETKVLIETLEQSYTRLKPFFDRGPS
jgi:ATP adenylyltransferase